MVDKDDNIDNKTHHESVDGKPLQSMNPKGEVHFYDEHGVEVNSFRDLLDDSLNHVEPDWDDGPANEADEEGDNTYR